MTHPNHTPFQHLIHTIFSLGLIQSSVEPADDEIVDNETIMMNEIQRTQQYDQVKNIASRSIAFIQELLQGSIGLLDRVVENVKKVE